MRLAFHLQPQNGIHRRGTARNRNDRCWFVKLRLDCRLCLAETRFVQHVGFRQHNQVGGSNLVRKQLVDRAFVIKFLIGSPLRLERVQIMRHPAIGQRRTINKRDNTVQHDL